MVRKIIRLVVWLALLGFVAIVVYGIAYNEYVWIIVSKGDNIPIGGMIPIVAFFTWIALKEAFKHDKLIREGRKNEILDEMRK